MGEAPLWFKHRYSTRAWLGLPGANSHDQRLLRHQKQGWFKNVSSSCEHWRTSLKDLLLLLSLTLIVIDAMVMILDKFDCRIAASLTIAQTREEESQARARANAQLACEIAPRKWEVLTKFCCLHCQNFVHYEKCLEGCSQEWCWFFWSQRLCTYRNLWTVEELARWSRAAKFVIAGAPSIRLTLA